MVKLLVAVSCALIAAGTARATTVTSSTLANICNARITLYGSPAVGGTVTLYQGNLPKGAIAIELFPNQGTRVCYSRAVDPNDCSTGQMTPEVCAPVTSSAGDIFDVH